MSTDLPEELDSLDSLKKLEKYCQDTKGANFIFRGQNERYSTKNTKGDGVSSKLYRWGNETAKSKEENTAKSKEKNTVKSKGANTAPVKLFNEYYQPPDMEKEVVEKAKRLFPDGTSNRTILTNLQHLRGRTNLIDFSRNLYVALFFACDGKYEKDGELILINTQRLISTEKMKKINDIDYDDLHELAVMEPSRTQLTEKRVIVQHSIFVYAKEGHIEQRQYATICVPQNFKKQLLEHLSQIHNVHIDSIYNDLMGFVENEQNYQILPSYFYEGNAYVEKGKYDSAIVDYSRAIDLKPNIATAYFSRANAYRHMADYDSAIVDYAKAIDLKLDYAEAYNNRGGV